MKLLFVDSGRGISSDFVRNKLFVPFAQQNPLDSGTGLGLSLVYNAIQELDGKIGFHTDELEGTEFLVTLPRNRLAEKSDETHISPDDTQQSREGLHDFSGLNVRLLPPGRWNDENDLRHQRCLNALTTSLAHTLNTWCHIDLQLWTQPWTIPEIIPDVVFVLHTDLGSLREVAGNAYECMQKVISCPNLQAEAHVRESEVGTYVTIVGPIVPSKICAAIATCYRNIQDETNAHRETTQRDTSADCSGKGISGHEDKTSEVNGSVHLVYLVKPVRFGWFWFLLWR